MADVSVDLELNAKQAKSELSSFEGTLKGFAGSAKSAIVGFAAGFAGVFSLGAIKDVITSTIHYGSTIQDLSDKYHVGTTFLQRYGQAAEKAGASQESLAKALKFLEINQAKALGGDDKAISKFADAGIGLEELRASNPEEIFQKVSLAGLDAAQMVGLLGKGAIELVGLFDQLQTGTVDLNTSIVSPEDIALLDKFDDTIKTVSNSLRKYAAVLVTETGPALADFTLKAIEALGPIKAFNEFIRRGDKTPQGAEASPEDTALAAQIHAQRERQAGTSLPQELAAEENLTKKKDLPETHKKKKTDKEQAAEEKKFEQEARKELDDADKAVVDEIKHGQGGLDEQKRKKQEAQQAFKAARAVEKDQFGGGTFTNPNNLTLQDLAGAPNSIGNAQASKAKEALREEKQARDDQIAGRLGTAREHKSRAEQLKKELGLKEPRDEFKAALDESQTLKKIEKNTAGAGANK